VTVERLRAPHLLMAALCAGLALPLALPLGGVRVAIVAAALAAGAPCLAGPRRLLVAAAALALAGAWWADGRLASLDASLLESRVDESALARVEVTGPARRGLFALRVPVRVKRFDRLELDEPARLELPLERAPPQGAILQVVATVKRPRAAEEEGDFDEAAYLRRQGVHVVLRAGWYRELGRRGGFLGAVDGLRRRLAGSIAPGLEGERGALVAGVVLGEDEKLSEPLRDDFRASGLYHLLAVSGQNVAYVVFGMLLLAWLAGLPRWAGHLAALAGVLGYTCAVGWQPSVVRAGVAGSLASLAWLAARPADRWYFLLVGAAVLLAVNPYSLLEPGFQLSFAAVAGIFVLVPRIGRRLEGSPVPRALHEVVSVSLACGLVTAPILWLQFGAIPIYSVVANALAFPVVAPLLGFALVCAALDPVLPAAAAALAWTNGWLAAYLAWCARLVGGLPHAQAMSFRAVLLIGALAAIAWIAVRLRPPRAPRLAALSLVVAVLGVGWRVPVLPGGAAPPPPTGLRVTFLDVGQGDAVLLQVPEGAVLVDQGTPEAEVADRLSGLGVRRLAALVLTHPQRDHVGGAAEVLGRVWVGFVLDPGLTAESPEWEAALAAARDRDVPVRTAGVGQRYRLGRLELRVLWPDGPGSPGQDPNDRAIVLVASFGTTDVLLTADAESHVLVPLRPPAVEVLKVSHHGSADERLPELLAGTRPRVAVISVGDGNSYGHPAPSTVAALEDAPGLAVYRTDRDGDVVLESDGQRLTVRTGR
jgi:competence protein ComEC